MPVAGKVTLDGNPLHGGTVSLRSADNRTLHQPTGRISSDGAYVVYTNNRPGAPLGPYKVVVFSTETPASPSGAAHPGLPKSVIPKRYNDPARTPFQVDVTSDSRADQYNLELKSRD